MAAATPLSDSPLSERLVEVALGLLAEEGLEALSLRSIARRAGVSHGAPARHPILAGPRYHNSAPSFGGSGNLSETLIETRKRELVL